MRGVILLVDNQPDVLDKWGRLLEGDGYTVVRAITLEEAENVLRNEWIQLAILDIRMSSEDDENDISGLLLAEKPEFGPVPKIVLTAYPSYQYARQALAPDLDGQRAAINFVAKAEGPQALRKATQEAFAQQIRANWDLNIHWDRQHKVSYLCLASLLEPHLANKVLIHRAYELEDLLRRVFRDFRQVRINRLVWQTDNRICLSVLAQSPRGAIDSYILVCGQRAEIVQELRQVRELAPELIQGPKLDSVDQTMHFGAMSYLLSTTDIDAVQSFREAFRSSPERDLRKALVHLLNDVLGAWHQRGELLEETQDLMSLYRKCAKLDEATGLSRAEVEQKVESLLQVMRSLDTVQVERGMDQSITFHYPNQKPFRCPDPVRAIYRPLDRSSPSTICRVSPGQLSIDNLFIDPEQETWLTDFACSGQVPQWWDFCCLEALFRFDLSQAPDLLAWLDLEECLVSQTRFQDRLQAQDVIPALRKNVNLIKEIRRQAGAETGQDIQPYYAGLLVWTLGEIARYDPSILHTRAEQMRGAHLLLAAALIARQLQEPLEHSVVEGRLRLDPDGTAWIGDRRVATLVGQELELLKRLFEREGQILNREEIIERVLWEERILDADSYDTRINNLVNRLRQDIEPDPSHPRYVITVRNRGYYLCAEGTRDE